MLRLSSSSQERSTGLQARSRELRSGQSGRLLLALTLVVLAVVSRQASAQAARVAGALTSFGSSVTGAVGTAVDSASNVYVVTSMGSVYKESLSATTGAYTENFLFTTASASGSGVAVDKAGSNIYIGTGTGKTVVKYTGSGTSYASAATFSGFSGNTAPAVDTNGNLYVADAGSGDLYEETSTSGSATLPTPIATGFGVPSYITVDASGNIFVSDSKSNTIDEVSSNGTTYTNTALTISGLSGIEGIGVDAAGDLFVQETFGVVEATRSGSTYTNVPFYAYAGLSLALDSAGNVYLTGSTQSSVTKLTVGSGYLNFGSVDPGAPASMTIAFTLTANGNSNQGTTLGTPTVVTQGLQGYDYTLGTGGTCKGANLTAGMSCTVVVLFSPTISGSRLGAVNLISGSSVLASSFIGGIGRTPLALFQSTTLLQLVTTGLNSGRGISLDPAGNIYVANSLAEQILKFTAPSYTQSTLATTGTCSPVGTAIDGQGDLFYTCNDSTNMYELVPGSSTPIAIPVGYPTDDHLSVDAAGNLYTTSYSPTNLFLKIAAGTRAVTVLATAPTSARFVGATTDSAGNTFAPDYNGDTLYELPAGSGTLNVLYTGASLQQPHAIAEDAAGNLYVANTTGAAGAGSGNLIKFAAGNYGATPATIPVPGADSLVIDNAGNFYTLYTNTNLAIYTRSTLTLTYTAPVGQTSAPQTVVLENDGTAPLTFGTPTSGTNPSLSAYFNLSSGTCPQLSASSTPATLATGSTCTDLVTFTPQKFGAAPQGYLTYTDNSLNFSGSTQTVTLNASATIGTPTVTVTNVTAVAGTTPVLTAVVSGNGVAPTGTLTFKAGSGATVAATCAAQGTNAESCTASYATTGLSLGNNVITATFAGDTNYMGLSATGTLTINGSTTSTVSSSLNPSTFGTPVTFTATVSSTSGTPTGSVTFSDGSTTLGTVTLSSGVATLPIATLVVGTHPITVSYTPTGYFTSSTASLSPVQTVNAAANYGDVLTGSPTSSIYGGSVRFTDTLTTLNGTAPTGSVKFYNNNSVYLGTGALSAGVASFSTTALPTGTDSITAVYAGDGNYSGETSNILIYTVGKIAVTAGDTAIGTGTYGATTAAVTVSIPYSNPTAPTGTVTVSDTHGNSAVASGCTAANSVLTCTATFPSTNLLAGADALTVAQATDSNYLGSSGSGTLTIGKAALTTGDTATGTGTFGAATATVTVSIPFAGPIPPTGTVTVSDLHTNTAVASGCTATGSVLTCTATFPTAHLSAGADALTVAQASDSNYLGSTGSGSLTLNKIAATTGDSATGTGTYGATTVALTVTIPYSTSTAPTGTVTVSDTHGNTAVAAGCTGTSGVLTCTATFPSANLLAGADALTVNQTADNNYAGSSGSGSLTLNKIAATTGDSATGTGTYGAANTSVTVTIPYGGTTAPTGAVTVSDTHGNTAMAAGCTGTNGVLTCTAVFPTANLAAGADALTVSQALDNNYSGSTGSGSLTLNKVAATTGDSATGTGTYGAANTSVTVTIPYGGTTAPTGAVTVSDTHGNTAMASGCTGTNGVLTCTAVFPTANLAAGADALTVSQALDNNYSGSTGVGSLTLNKIALTTGDSVTGSGSYGATTVPVTVTIPYSGTTAPIGAITVSDNQGNTATASGCTAASSVLTCTATFPTANLGAGADALTVNQAADGNYLGSSGVGSLTLNKIAATTGDSATGTGTFGAVTVSVTVTIPYGGTTAPTGTITVSDLHNNSATALGCSAVKGVLTCTATFPTANLAAGADALTVNQAADSNYAGSGGTGTLTLNKLALTTGDGVTGTGTYGAATTPVTVTIPYSGSTAPAGSITVSDTQGNTVTIPATGCAVSKAMLSCRTDFPTATLGAGSDALTVNQAADGNYAGSSGSGSLTLNKVPVTTTDSVTGSGTFGSATSPVTVTIPYSGATAPTGTITVADTQGNTVTVPNANCSAAKGLLTCTANFPSMTLAAGNDTLSVTQAMDTNYAGSTGSGLLTIDKAGVTNTDSVTGAGIFGAATVPVTVTIPFSGPVAPAGPITVVDGHGNTVTVSASACTSAKGVLACTANFPSANLLAGTDALSVSQAVDANYPGSTGSGSLTLSMVPATATDTAMGTGVFGSATTPITVVIPYSGSIPSTGAITVTDALGNIVTVPASGCTAASGVLSCTAAFPTATLSAGTDTLTVSQAPDANYAGSTGSGALVLSQAATSPLGSTASSLQNVTITQGTSSALLTATIIYSGAVAPTGAVNFAVANGSPVLANCTTGASPLTCTASYPTSNLSQGTYPITATEAADANYPAGSASSTLVVLATGAITVSPILDTGSSVSNIAITQGTPSAVLMATIVYNGPVPVGAVTFTVAGSSMVTAACAANASILVCTATYPTADLALGTYTLTATEAADVNYPAGVATGTVTVLTAGSTVSPPLNTYSNVGNVSIPQGTANAALTVSIVYTGTAPTGAVSFTVAGGAGGAVPASCSTGPSPLTCTALYPSQNLGEGSYTITASEVADANYPAGNALGTLTITQIGLSSGDTVTGTGTYGAATTPITINIPYSGSVTPTGTITVADGQGNTVTVAASSCTAANAVLTCTANFPTASLSAGPDSLTVTQGADTNYAGSTGTGSLTLNKVAATSTDTATGTGTYGAATASVTVTIPYSGPAASTGAVTVADTHSNIITVPASSCTGTGGVLTCTVAFPSGNLAAGADTLTVAQAADNNYAGSTGTGTLTLNKTGASTGDTVSGTGLYGAPTTTITVTIPYSGPTAPTGAVRVTDNQGNTLAVPASSCTAANGVLTCTAAFPTASVPAGTDTLTVTQAADGNYAGSTGSGSLTLNKIALTTGDSVTGTGTYGAATTPVTVAIPYSGTTAPTGAITVSDSQGNTVTVQAATCTAAKGALTCTANFPTGTLAAGADALSVSQAGDSNYAGSTGTGTLTLNKIAAANGDTATGTGTYGAATVPVTVAIPYSGTTAPTGAITVSDSQGNTVTVQAATCTAAKGALTCTANFPTGTLAAGADALSVSQAADSNYAGSSGTGTLTLNKIAAANGDTATGTGTYGAATVPVTVTIPYSGSAAPTGTITVTDAQGNTLTVPASSCTAAKGVLTCTANFPTANLGAGSDPLTVTQAADANYAGSTGSGTLTVTKASGNADTVTGTGIYGAATTPVTVTIPYSGSTAPTGAITVADSQGNTVTVPASGCTASKGVLTCTAAFPTATLAAGNDPLTVAQAADANYSASNGAGSLTLNKVAATNTDTVSGTGVLGEATTPLTVIISYGGPAAPTGTITITDGQGNTLTVPASSCTAAKGALTCTVNFPTANLAVGSDPLTVTQAADANYAGSTGSGSLTINKGASGNGDTATGTGTYGAATVPVTVLIPYTGSTPPSGAIKVADSQGDSLTISASSCTAAKGVLTCTAGFPTADLGAGADPLTVAQAADANYAASSGAGTLTLNKATATVTVSSSPNPSSLNQAVVFTVAVTKGATGTVQFMDGSTLLGTGNVAAGVATFSTSTLALGSHPVTAHYSGDANYTAVVSATDAQVVAGGSGTSTTLTSSNPSQLSGQAVTLTATVAAPGATSTTFANSTVSFYSGTTLLGTSAVNASGVAVLTTSSLPAGVLSITAVYTDGSGVNLGSTSNVVSQSILDFSLKATVPSVTVNPGAVGSYNLVITQLAGVNFNQPVTLTLSTSGLPANFAVSFDPASVTPGTAGANSTLTIHTVSALAQTGEQTPAHRGNGYGKAIFALLFLPLLGSRRLRQRLPSAVLMLLVGVLSLGSVALLTGCGGGYFGTPPASYTMTVTATSGTLQHSTTVTLNVQ